MSNAFLLSILEKISSGTHHTNNLIIVTKSSTDLKVVELFE